MTTQPALKAPNRASTHVSTDPWSKNLHAPRSLRQAYGHSEDWRTRMDMTAGEKLVSWAAGIGYLLVVAYIYRAELCAMLGG